MRELADDVWQLSGKPADGLNVYLLGDVLIDSGLRPNASNILKQVEGRDLSGHALTHAHFDHYGASHAICEKLNIRLWVGELDAPAVEAGKMVGRFPLLGNRMVPAAKRHQVSRALREGDRIGGFEVLFTPGHSPGHISFWRESDRVLVCGDVMWGFNPFFRKKGIREPYASVSPDPKLNRESARRLAALEPELVCFGHGPPLRDPAAFSAAVAKLKG